MLTSRYPRPLPGRHRNDLLDLDNGSGSLSAMDLAAARHSLIEAGFVPCRQSADHWILSRGEQRIHLYGEAELAAFAQRYRPNRAPVALSDQQPKETCP
ncbi:hypothetical protein EZI54_01180 [Marinobacter halodurans]|uniref:Uncharacterized protein n=1 Tax=Marinobacter halodurans TaxID=2528979 RepID=A0ABY1ZR36_9GAMM|nr:hypothetical protein [Marinobacter halodurans]TBW59596.1 hypothetical protein EZI54_01180 [Marinobacter halodurans]